MERRRCIYMFSFFAEDGGRRRDVKLLLCLILFAV